jgi:opacity protein-like surface antigen
MKVRSKKDTTDGGIKKIRVIDGFGFNGGYNFLADSMKLSNINFYLRTNLLDKINLNATATMNPYQVDSLGRDINKYAWKGGRFSPGRITNVGISLSTSFQSKPKDEKVEKEKQDQLDQQMNDPVLAGDRQRLLDYMRQNPSEFVDFNIPWQVSLSYSFYVSEQYDLNLRKFTRTSSSNTSFNGSFNLTPKWNFSVNGYYNFDTKKLQTFTMSISRDMHCWQMSINVTPVGFYRFFNVTISPKSGILQDLRINRTRSFYSGL